VSSMAACFPFSGRPPEPSPLVIVVPNGWTNYPVEDQNFSIAVPASWQRLPVSEQELKDAKAYLTGSFPLRLDTSRKIVGMLATIEYYGLGLDYVDRYPGLINAVTAADVQRVAQKYLDPNRYALSIVADLSKAKIRE
jgi:predicted Zn-dependent peptidase